MYSETDLLPLSALQHYIYCSRQCALIHIEQQWIENRFTAEGRTQHERVDRQEYKMQDGIRIEYALPLRSLRLGLIGIKAWLVIGVLIIVMLQEFMTILVMKTLEFFKMELQ